MLFSITRVNTSRMRSFGKSVGIALLFSVRKSLIELMPMLISMFVYIDLASAENSSACYGICRCFRSVMILKEFLV